ncbi:MAG TPA: hypothetical protein ENH29_01885 [Bacteroidetes bacterium]|nr:hypothetical protein [Bacteroidota bacterium]
MFKLDIPPSERRVFTISNFFSLSRILLLPFILLFLGQPVSSRNNLMLAALLLIAVATDFLDGFFARRLNQISIIGRIIDPLADKICIGAVVVFLVMHRSFPEWMAVIVISRDVVIVLASIFITSKIKDVTPSNIIGKITVFFLALLIISNIFVIRVVQFPLIIISSICIVLSSVSYSKRFFSIIFPKKS